MLVALVLVNIAWVLVASRGTGSSGGDDRHLAAGVPHLVRRRDGDRGGAVRVEVRPRTPAASRAAGALQQMGRSPGACWTAALALFAIASTPLAGPDLLVPPTSGEAVTKNLLYAVIAGLLILPGVFADPAAATSG